MTDQEKRMFLFDQKVVKDSDKLREGKAIEVPVPSQQELEARGVWDDVKDGIVGSWEMFKSMVLDSEKQRQADNKSDQYFSPYEIEKTLDKHASKQGYSDEHQLTLAQFLLAVNEVANKYSIAEKDRLHDFMAQGPGINMLKLAIPNIMTGNDQINKKDIVITTKDRFNNTKSIECKINNSSFTFTIANEYYRILSKTPNKKQANTMKILNFLLTKANEQHFNEMLEFDLQELVDRGIYSSKDTAYRGLKYCIDILGIIEAEGTAKHKGKEVRCLKSRVFIGSDISYNNCTIYTVPGTIRWLTGFYSSFPRWAYKLNSKPFLLLDYIYYIANQRKKELLNNKGFFTIGLWVVNKRLGQPEPGETHRHTESIIDPILKAIEGIEENSLNDLKITPVFDQDYKNAHDFLRGYLRIELDKQTSEYLINKEKSWQKKIRQEKKKAAKKEG